MALSAFGMVASAILASAACHFFPAHARADPATLARRPRLTPRYYATHIAPVGLAMALTLHFGNVVYLHLSVAFIQMLKAFTPIVTMVALAVSGLERPRRALVASVALIAAGTALASYGEGKLSAVGLACMLASEAFEATRLVMTQSLLTGLKFHPIEGLAALAPACAAWLLIGSAALESRAMRAEGAAALVASRPFSFAAAACMGFACNGLAYSVIQLAGALTLKVIGTVKNALVVCAGVALYGDAVSGVQGCGYGLSLIGFGLYNREKMRQAAGSGGGNGNGGGQAQGGEGGGGGGGGEEKGPILPVVSVEK
jgi:hypothetical protein